jgi:hypothetical protein
MQKVTGRDGFIIKQALYCAIKFIDSLPEELQETSNQNDMKALLLATEPEIVELSQQNRAAYLRQAERTGEPVSTYLLRFVDVPDMNPK